MAQRRQKPASAVLAGHGAVVEIPPASRLVQRPGSPAAVMGAIWRDPTDLTPDARRQPRSITGWRGYDPLRKMAAHPRMGPAAMAETRAARSIRRVVLLYDPVDLPMLYAIVLRNQTLRQWILTRDPVPLFRTEKQRLLSILDKLAEHFDGEIQNELSMGRRLPP